ncbi:uncharacterized protein LOC135223738 [Macrobrachium nipponense]|uniref:uncharacterized protein LOC135223738 n=1 Tax=Macrobrachium nipponense TaxID=159736 RepID=UPI0030C841B8
MKKIMKMPSHIRMVMLLSIVSVHVLGDAVCPSRLYLILFSGGQKLSAPYVLFNTTNAIHCSSTCNANPSCWIYTWDTETRECGLLQDLSWPITTVAAPPSLRTYYVGGMNGKELKKSKSNGNWNLVKQECEMMGGRLFAPQDSTYGKVLHYVLGADTLWIGLIRKPTDDVYTWFDLDGNPDNTKLEWEPGQPNNFNGAQYYMSLEAGVKNDRDEAWVRYGVCEI